MVYYITFIRFNILICQKTGQFHNKSLLKARKVNHFFSKIQILNTKKKQLPRNALILQTVFYKSKKESNSPLNFIIPVCRKCAGIQ